MPRLEFWYDLASNYSYLSAMRIEALAARCGVDVVWRPFLLGPIFKAQGWNTSPFNIYPAKGRYMIRDMERISAERGIPFTMPAPFPCNSMLAARVALVGEARGWIAAFSKEAFQEEFGFGRQISDKAGLEPVLARMGLDAESIFSLAASDAAKRKLKERGARAQSLGVFGAPSFVTEDGELFWGDDRLEQALAWATRRP